MKLLKYIIIFIILIAALPIAAQEDQGIPEDLAQVWVQNAAAGTFISGEGDAYTLTLEGVKDSTPWLQEAPDLEAGVLATFTVALGWTEAEDLAVSEAVLRTEDATIVLTLSAPTYDLDTETMTYTAVVESIAAGGKDKGKGKPIPPKSFEEATLFIQVNNVFMEGFMAGREAAGLRCTKGVDC